MRFMLEFSLPVDLGNDLVRTGRMQEVLEGVIRDIKLEPEAAHFYPTNGQRGGHFIFDFADASQIISACESFWLGLNADVHVTPVTSVEDLQKGLANIGG